MLYAKSVDGLVFSDNRLIRSHDFAPFHGRKATVTLEYCRQVRIEGNRFEGEVLGRNIVRRETAEGEVKIGPDQGWAP